MDAAPSDRPSDASQVERAYREIKAGIVDGRYRPGAPLSEVMLAKAHNMSRTPVRESLTRLWQEHYLDRVAGHGYFVARVTVQLIHETFDVRRVLEGAAAAWAAERATEEEIAQLRHLASLAACGRRRSSRHTRRRARGVPRRRSRQRQVPSRYRLRRAQHARDGAHRSLPCESRSIHVARRALWSVPTRRHRSSPRHCRSHRAPRFSGGAGSHGRAPRLRQPPDEGSAPSRATDARWRSVRSGTQVALQFGCQPARDAHRRKLRHFRAPRRTAFKFRKAGFSVSERSSSHVTSGGTKTCGGNGRRNVAAIGIREETPS